MVWVSKTAIQCPSSTCNFAYIASSPDPAGRLRSHFNNIKVRDAEHESYFRKPFCVFCGDVITSKTRKGLWKSDMNKHWLVNHSAEFVEPLERHEEQERRIALILSPSQLERLSKEWQLEYILEDGDLITRKGRDTCLSRDIGVARIVENEPLPLLKRRKTSHRGAEPGGKTDTVANCDGENGPDLSSSVQASHISQVENPDRGMIQARHRAESQTSLIEHNGVSTIDIGNTENKRLRTRQPALEGGGIADSVPHNTDIPTSQEVFSAAHHESEKTGIHTDASQPDLNSMEAPGLDGILASISPPPDTFWYSFLEPLPIDVDLGSA